jgi:hypothetical protein
MPLICKHDNPVICTSLSSIRSLTECATQDLSHTTYAETVAALCTDCRAAHFKPGAVLASERVKLSSGCAIISSYRNCSAAREQKKMAASKKRKKSRQSKKVRKATNQRRRQKTSKSGKSKQPGKSPATIEEPLAENPPLNLESRSRT